MAKNKNVKSTKIKSERKVVENAVNSDTDCPIWIFTDIDRDGYFAFDVRRDDFNHYEVLDKLIYYSNMKWADIKKQTHDKGKSKHHLLSYEKLSKEAKERLRIKDLEEESDNVFSFAFDNLLRIIGIRRGRDFYVTWYDPKHEFCPSGAKN